MNTLRKALISVGLVGSTLTGGAIGAALMNGTANAADAGTSTSATATAPAAGVPATTPPANGPGRHGGPGGGNFDPSQGGHVGQNGVTEALLTGDTAAKVKAAALAAVPGGTVERVENDAEGSPYEAHMTKADGSHVTVKVDNNFAVTTIENN
jgi:ABC-type transport system substrate-binding protein